jgi:hypothetical protein
LMKNGLDSIPRNYSRPWNVYMTLMWCTGKKSLVEVWPWIYFNTSFFVLSYDIPYLNPIRYSHTVIWNPKTSWSITTVISLYVISAYVNWTWRKTNGPIHFVEHLNT